MSDIEYLKSLQAVRERAQLVLQAASRDELSHFHYDAAKMSTVVEFVTGIITVCPDGESTDQWLMTRRSETLARTSLTEFLLTADGNTLILETSLGSTNSLRNGRLRDAISLKLHAAWLISSLSPFCWTLVLGICGSSQSPVLVKHTGGAKESQSHRCI